MVAYRRIGVAVFLGALSGCAAGFGGDGDDTTGEPPVLPVPPTDEGPGDPYAPAPALGTLDPDQLSELGVTIDAILANPVVAATSMSIQVVDAETGQVVYERNPDLALKPASNTKLFTTALALEVFGEDDRLATTITADALPSAGVVGDLVLQGGFDFSWSPLVLDRSRLAIDDLVQQLKAAGITSIDGTLWIAGEYLIDGAQFGTYDANRERGEVADAVASALSSAGISVEEIKVGETAQKAIELARFESPPLLVGATPLNRVSHNEFADILARYASFRLAGSSTQWSTEVAAWAEGFEAGDQLLLGDGSGLSHGNRATARSVIDLFKFMLTRPEGRSWLRTMTIAGYDGTLSSRLTGSDTVGRVWGKTGTLTGAIATSGVVFNLYDGRRYLFSILMNETGSASSTRAVQDQVITAIAGDLRAAERPAAPAIHAVQRFGRAIGASWAEVEGATGYLVWLSKDGRTWDRDEARLVTRNTYVSEAMDDATVYVRVSAIGERGESDVSSVYAAGLGEKRVLVVEGNDRWLMAPGNDNPLGTGHDFVVSYARALEGQVGYDTLSNEVAVTAANLRDYDAVIWMTGEDGTEALSLSEAERAELEIYLDRGGRLMISGSEIGWHLAENGTADEQAFYENYLRAQYLGDDAGTSRARPRGQLFSDTPSLGFYTPAEILVGYPDVLAPADGASVALDYDGDLGNAAITYQGDYSLVYFGFPFEAIDNGPERRQLMAEVLGFFEQN